MIEIAAEISGNHGGSLDSCLKLIGIAKNLGCTVKLQRFDAERLAKKRKENIAVLKAAGNVLLHDLYRQVETPREWWPEIVNVIGKSPWTCSIFSPEDVDFVVKYNCPTLKIASFELIDTDLISYAAQTERPIIISANKAADETDIAEAFWAAEDADRVTMLYATAYQQEGNISEWTCLNNFVKKIPADLEYIGLSDHTPNTVLAVQALRYRLSIIERHLCLPEVVTPDTPFSFTPSQMQRFMEVIRAEARAR